MSTKQNKRQVKYKYSSTFWIVKLLQLILVAGCAIAGLYLINYEVDTNTNTSTQNQTQEAEPEEQVEDNTPSTQTPEVEPEEIVSTEPDRGSYMINLENPTQVKIEGFDADLYEPKPGVKIYVIEDDISQIARDFTWEHSLTSTDKLLSMTSTSEEFCEPGNSLCANANGQLEIVSLPSNDSVSNLSFFIIDTAEDNKLEDTAEYYTPILESVKLLEVQ